MKYEFYDNSGQIMILSINSNRFLLLFFLLSFCFAEKTYCSKSFSYPRSSVSTRRSLLHIANNTAYRSYGDRVDSSHYQEQSINWRKILLIILFLALFLWFVFCGNNLLPDQYRPKYLKIRQSNQQNVHEDYNQIADWFDKNRSRAGYEKKYLNMVLDAIPQSGTILDLGCGMAEPVTGYLIKKGYEVTGVEGSGKLISMARQRYPKTEFIYADMRLIHLDRKFDAIILWHSFFHLSWQDQRAMFPLLVKHLKPGGILLFTAGPQAGEVWSNNGGIEIYHASLLVAEYQRLLEENHFKLLLHVIEDPSCGDATVWIAQYLPSINISE